MSLINIGKSAVQVDCHNHRNNIKENMLNFIFAQTRIQLTTNINLKLCTPSQSIRTTTHQVPSKNKPYTLFS